MVGELLLPYKTHESSKQVHKHIQMQTFALGKAVNFLLKKTCECHSVLVCSLLVISLQLIM